MKDLINYLNEKYVINQDSVSFGKNLNDRIDKFFANESNVDSFLKWLSKSKIKLNIDLKQMISTFFPSLSFSVTHEIIEYMGFRIYKEEIFCVSFIEDYYTSCFISYIREQKEGHKLTYRPIKRPIRDSKFDANSKKIIDEIQKRYPNKIYLDIQNLNYVLSDYQLTYSGEPKTTIFELLFRKKNK